MELIKEFENYLLSKRLRVETIKTYILVIKQFLSVIKKLPQNLNKDDLLRWEDYCKRFDSNSLVSRYIVSLNT